MKKSLMLIISLVCILFLWGCNSDKERVATLEQLYESCNGTTKIEITLGLFGDTVTVTCEECAEERALKE